MLQQSASRPVTLAEVYGDMLGSWVFPGVPVAPGIWWAWAAMIFGFGLLFGSFFNVCIYRSPVNKSIVSPPSHCYSCGSFLQWYDNIPLLSYLLLRGNCRSCGAHFSSRYFFVELLTGFLFLAVYWQYGPHWPTLLHLAFASLLLVGIFIDLDHFVLPDGVTIGGFFFAVIATGLMGRWSIAGQEFGVARDFYYSLVDYRKLSMVTAPIPWWGPVLWSLAGAGFGWLLLWAVGVFGTVVFRKEAMGFGDVKLFAFLGAYMGPLNCLWILFLSSMLGAVVGVSFIIAHRLLRGDQFEEMRLAGSRFGDWNLGVAAVPADAGLEYPRSIQPDTVPAGSSSDAPAKQPPELTSEQPITEAAVRTGDSEGGSGVFLRVPKKTANQVGTIPYGPYIAVAAILIMLFYRDLHIQLRKELMLPRASVELDPERDKLKSNSGRAPGGRRSSREPGFAPANTQSSR